MKCGACKGRGFHKPLRGVEMIDCEKCGGTGDFEHKAKLGSRAVSLGRPPHGVLCKFCHDRPAVEYHHAIPQNRINSHLPADLAQEAKGRIEDGVPTCRPCHDTAERGFLRVEPHHLHPRFWAYVREYDLLPIVPQHLAERMPA